MSTNCYEKLFDSIEKLIKDFKQTTRYVRIDKKHLLVDSQEYLNLLLRIGDELETYITMFVRMFDSNFNNKNVGIMNFYDIAKNRCKCLFQKSVFLQPVDWIVYPWNFEISNGKAKAPEWWHVYNKIKHEKYSFDTVGGEAYYHNANLKNVLFALSALYLLYICIRDNRCSMSLNRMLMDELGETMNICTYDISSLEDFMSVLVDKHFYINGNMFYMNKELMITRETYYSYIGIK